MQQERVTQLRQALALAQFHGAYYAALGYAAAARAPQHRAEQRCYLKGYKNHIKGEC